MEKSEAKKRIAESRKKYQEESKKRLNFIQKKKLQTSFIGAISEFEAKFGFLWGLEPEGGYTDEQYEILKLLEKAGFTDKFFKIWWEDARNRVLNNGNNQVRGLMQEMETYTVHWDKYRIELPVINPGDNNG